MEQMDIERGHETDDEKTTSGFVSMEGNPE